MHALLMFFVPLAPVGVPDGDAMIAAPYGGSQIVIITTRRTAGAIHSLRWNGQEFVDSFDHGRQIQSASNLDCGRNFIPEVYNPTEAGSARDGRGPRSSSKLIAMQVFPNELRTTTAMAFWLAPGEKSQGHPARNTTVLSNHWLSKQVKIGFEKWPNVIQYNVSFHMPPNERHTYAQFEAVTGYMPAEFRAFYRVDGKTGTLHKLDDGPGEQPDPVILSLPSGTHAMGVYSPDQPSTGFENAGYGRFRFVREKVVKWNCVFRVQDKDGVRERTYSYRNFIIVGDLATVHRTIRELHEVYHPQKK